MAHELRGRGSLWLFTYSGKFHPAGAKEAGRPACPTRDPPCSTKLPAPPEDTELARAIVGELLSGSYHGAAVFVGGSFLGPDATPTSDLDLVIVFDRVVAAWRDTLLVHITTLEIFAHDPGTFAHFCNEVDGPSGVSALPEMVVQGTCLTPEHPMAARILGFASRFLIAGPPPLDATALAMRRYATTTPIEDLGDARWPDEALMIAADLQAALADLALRGAGLWSGKGKQLAGRLRRHDEPLADALDDALRHVARGEEGATGAFEAAACWSPTAARP